MNCIGLDKICYSIILRIRGSQKHYALLLCGAWFIKYLSQLHYYESVCPSSLTAEVLIWLTVGCGCSYSVHEQSGSLEVCAEILFINGTATTISDYNVSMSTAQSSAISE